MEEVVTLVALCPLFQGLLLVPLVPLPLLSMWRKQHRLPQLVVEARRGIRP
jgi:hypothetical protein